MFLWIYQVESIVCLDQQLECGSEAVNRDDDYIIGNHSESTCCVDCFAIVNYRWSRYQLLGILLDEAV